MGVKELLHELLVNDNVQFGEIDTYNHIRKTTNNFEIKCIQLLYVDLLWFIQDICMTFENEIYPLQLLSEISIMHPYDIRKYGVHNGEKLKETINYGDWKEQNIKENKISTYIELAFELKWNNPGLELEYDINQVREYVNMFNDILKRLNIDIEEMMKDEDWKLKLERKNKRLEPKQPLNFYLLFKDPYNKDLEHFKKILKGCNLIDDNFQWRTVDNNGKKVPIRDIGKFYIWLYSETNVFDKTEDMTAHCICFCAEFGIIAYEGTENKPETGRIVTAKLIRESKFDTDLEEKYKYHFKTWINKEK